MITTKSAGQSFIRVFCAAVMFIAVRAKPHRVEAQLGRQARRSKGRWGFQRFGELGMGLTARHLSRSDGLAHPWLPLTMRERSAALQRLDFKRCEN